MDSINYYDDDFLDYFFDSFDMPEQDEDARREELVKKVDFRTFSNMNNKEKIDCLYYQISNLYSILLSIQDVVQTRRLNE